MKIIGTGRAHPVKEVTNAMLEKFLDTSDEWIKERTGMSVRKVISDEKLEDLAIEASRQAIVSPIFATIKSCDDKENCKIHRET